MAFWKERCVPPRPLELAAHRSEEVFNGPRPNVNLLPWPWSPRLTPIPNGMFFFFGVPLAPLVYRPRPRHQLPTPPTAPANSLWAPQLSDLSFESD